MSASDLLLFGEIGADRYLSLDEVPGHRRNEFVERAWSVYVEQFDAFTGAALDPMFHRIENPAHSRGGLCFGADSLALVVGTGPSSRSSLDAIMRSREGALILTSPRGAAMLASAGIRADIVLIEHTSCLEAELSVRQPPEWSPGPDTWVAIEPKTPRGLLPRVAPERICVPTPWFGWGLWPATAVAMALYGGCSRVGLLGIDLGIAGAPDPQFASLSALLTTLAHIPVVQFADCGATGVEKPGWPKLPLRGFLCGVSHSIQKVTLSEASSLRQWLVEERTIIESLKGLADESRAMLAVALHARAGSTGLESALVRSIRRMLEWGSDTALRRALQEGLGLSYLPRFWRTGIDLGSGSKRIWRPVVLALRELVGQFEALDKRIDVVSEAGIRG